MGVRQDCQEEVHCTLNNLIFFLLIPSKCQLKLSFQLLLFRCVLRRIDHLSAFEAQQIVCLYNFFFFSWLCWVFIAVCRLSLVVVSGGYSSFQCAGFSLSWLLLLRSTGSRRAGFSSCGMWTQQLWLAGSRAQAQQLWRMGLVAPRHVGSSRARARTRIPCIGRRILNHCTTRETLSI